MPSTGKRLCFNLLQQKAVLSLAVSISCKHVVNLLVGPRQSRFAGLVVFAKSRFWYPTVWNCLAKAKHHPCRAESFPSWGFIFLKVCTGAPYLRFTRWCWSQWGQYLPPRWTAAAFCSLSCGDAAFFASCHGDSLRRLQRVSKPNCKQIWIDGFNYVNTPCRLFLFYSVVKKRKIHSHHF